MGMKFKFPGNIIASQKRTFSTCFVTYVMIYWHIPSKYKKSQRLGAVTGDEIAVDEVVAADLAVDGVVAADLAADGVVAADLAADGVVAANLAVDGVVAVDLAAEGVVAADLAADGVVASGEAAEGVFAAGVAMDEDVTGLFDASGGRSLVIVTERRRSCGS
jgi:hypothetical protein